MKYEKPEVDVVEFDFSEFMICSSNPGNPDSCPSDAGYGHTCGAYVKGESCTSWTTTSFGGGSCRNYNGHKCYGYTDSTHTKCAEYGITCGSF